MGKGDFAKHYRSCLVDFHSCDKYLEKQPSRGRIYFGLWF